MEEEITSGKEDLMLAHLIKQDLYDLSVEDLSERITNMEAEIARCRQLIDKRGSSRQAAESLFKSRGLKALRQIK